MPTRFLRQHAASDRERFLESMLESATDYAIITLDSAGLITGWTGGAEAILGWDEAEVLGLYTDLLFTTEDRAAGIPGREIATARRRGKVAGERWHIRKDGRRFWADGSLMPLVDGDGYLKILRDRTAQRERDEATRESEAFLRSVLESSGDCIKVLDPNGRLEFMSPGGKRVMEVDDFCSIQGSYWPDFWQGEGRAAAEAAMALAHEGGVGHFLGVARTAKGSPRWWDVQVSHIPVSDGTSGKLLSISRDITQDRDRQLAIRAQNARLTLLSDMASQLIGGHDPDTVLETLFQAAAAHLGLDVCVHLTPDVRGALRLQSCVGVEPGEAARLARLDPGETICGWVAQTRQPLYLPDVQVSQDAHAREVQGLGVQAYACNPLVANGQFLGTLSFGSRMRATFSDEDHAFFRTISTYVAVIKERKRAEIELKDTEARLRLAVEATDIGIFDHDLTTGVLRWDSRTKELFGLPGETEVNYEGTFLAGLHPNDRGAADRAVQDAVDPAGPGVFDIEFRTIAPSDGETRWIAARGRAVREHGHTIRLIGTVRDITEKRQADEVLRSTVERYRLVTQATNDAIWDWDLVANHVLWNEALCTAYGYSPDDVAATGEWWIDHIHPEDRERVEQDIRAVINGSASEWSHEYRFRRASGQYADVLDRGYMVRSPTGTPVRMIGAMLDITERKRAEQQLRLLHRELGHRLKNVLTMAQAIATQTLRNAESMEAARDKLAARLVTMGRAQDVLIAGTAEEADIQMVLASALEPHDDPQADRFRLRGPKVRLNPSAALSLALLVHELATNAHKYGALSAPQGYVELNWTLTDDDQDPCLVLSWSEHGGPLVVAPSRKGFGTRLITRGLAGDVGGNVRLEYEPIGVVCTLTAPLAGLTEPHRAAS
jgi:PAS domain S-box-containing protein